MSFPNVVLPGGADAVRRRRAARSSSPPSRGPISAGSATPGRDRSSSRASTPATTRGAPSTTAPTPSSCPTTADVSSTACTATMRVLPEVVAAVNGQAEVLLDGGIRRGSDVVKALCLGARAVLIGRAYAYGLGAAGRPRRRARDRDPAGRRDAHDQAARLPDRHCAERVVHRRALGVVQGRSSRDSGLGTRDSDQTRD